MKNIGLTKEEWEWEVAKTEMTQVLEEVAAQRGMISYSDLVQKVETIKFEPGSYNFWRMLGEISDEEEAQGRGLLSAIVVHKSGNMEPGKGFYELPKAHGRDTSDLLRCWVDELHAVHAQWSNVAAQSL
jgi:hypothetical protein